MKKSGYLAAALAAVMISQTGCAMLGPGALFAVCKMTGSADAGAKAETEAEIRYEMMVEEEYEACLADNVCEAAAMSQAAGYGEPTEIWPGPDWNTEEYNYIEENRWMSSAVSPFSTFAADVDTASYANIRRMLMGGQNVVSDAVRLEEMINYFHYDYPQPEGEEPFSVTMEVAPCPWNVDTHLLMIGMQAKELDPETLPPSNLVFLIDVSGSMDTPDKLPLVQRAFRMAAENMTDRDTISIVTYASNDRVVLDGVSADRKAQITEAIEDLMAGGGTYGSAGIETAYALAEKHFIKGGNNRVILATDGDLNIGITDEGSLTRLIREKAQTGIYLSVLGFGQGNLSDARMEALADNGNGNYSYIDDIAEARRVLIQEMGGTLFTVAKDVKLQMEFNPEVVKGYRLIGYENRKMAAEDFADDTKDGGELGAGHRVTVLYELALAGSAQEIPEVTSHYAQSGNGGRKEDAENDAAGGELGYLNVRYKQPDEDESRLLEYPVTEDLMRGEMSENMSWAAGVAQAGMLLKHSQYCGTSDYESITQRLQALPQTQTDTYKREFVEKILPAAQWN